MLGLLANPPDVLADALPGDPATLPERVLRALLGAWDDPLTGRQLHMLVTAATQDPELVRLLRDVVGHEIIDRVADHIGGVDARGRAAAFGTQLAGLIFLRHVLAVEPVASMTADESVVRFSPGPHAALARRTRRGGRFGPVPNRSM